jgi:hypothetical protein
VAAGVHGHHQRRPGLAQPGQRLPGSLIRAGRDSRLKPAMRRVGHALPQVIGIYRHCYLLPRFAMPAAVLARIRACTLAWRPPRLLVATGILGVIAY